MNRAKRISRAITQESFPPLKNVAWWQLMRTTTTTNVQGRTATACHLSHNKAGTTTLWWRRTTRTLTRTHTNRTAAEARQGATAMSPGKGYESTSLQKLQKKKRKETKTTYTLVSPLCKAHAVELWRWPLWDFVQSVYGKCSTSVYLWHSLPAVWWR